MILGLEFPPVSHLIEWPTIFGSGVWAVNKVVLLMWLAVVLVAGFYLVAGSRQQLVPRGVQNVAEAVVDFIREGIVHQTIGPDGTAYIPFLLTLFSFILVLNLYEVIPLIQMPVTARMALPAFMSLLVWVVFNFVGMKKQGVLGYFKNMMFPPGVPVFLYILVAPIELVSTVIVRPLSLAVRLFANLLAGHLILVSFAVLGTALWESTYIGAALPGALLVALTGFEVLVSALQAYIFTILAAVYIGGALHPEH
ncbi:MAG TPA: F0F1 ATP synthase subunit A [Acidimicrobiales bacterium]|jgi:F-type H+-transporting ATPase subunit a